jgi:hypothetical protein
VAGTAAGANKTHKEKIKEEGCRMLALRQHNRYFYVEGYNLGFRGDSRCGECIAQHISPTLYVTNLNSFHGFDRPTYAFLLITLS